MRDPVRSRRDIVIGGVHLAVLSALALAQPVLDILGKNLRLALIGPFDDPTRFEPLLVA